MSDHYCETGFIISNFIVTTLTLVPSSIGIEVCS